MCRLGHFKVGIFLQLGWGDVELMLCECAPLVVHANQYFSSAVRERLRRRVPSNVDWAKWEESKATEITGPRWCIDRLFVSSFFVVCISDWKCLIRLDHFLRVLLVRWCSGRRLSSHWAETGANQLKWCYSCSSFLKIKKLNSFLSNFEFKNLIFF